MDEAHRRLEGKPVAWNVIDLTRFDEYQLFEIGIGLAHGIDVSRYADPEYDAEDMHEIRHSLEARTEGWETWFDFVSGDI
jgi:LPS sulfotransferase NodH